MIRSGVLALLLVSFLGTPAAGQTSSPDSARIVSDDVLRFWTAFDRAGEAAGPAVFDSLYLIPGSEGLREFTRSRIGSAEQLAAAVRGNRGFYASVRESTLRIPSLEGRIREAFRAFQGVYPEAVFPDVYIVMGRLSAAGTISSRGLLIGAEHFGRTERTPLEELNAWERSVVRPLEALPHVVVHELVHMQQRAPEGELTLLVQAIAEGVADFLAELVSGGHGNEALHAWAAPREAELWREFEREMHGEKVENWLYNGARSQSRPADLGYWIGYRIARSYYAAAADKQEAVRNMLTIEDYPAFLRESGYAERF